MAEITLGPVTFPRKQDAAEWLRSLTARPDGKITDPAEDAALRALLDRHPDAARKIGPGVKHFGVGTPPGHQSRGFAARRVDGTLEWFSWPTCLRGTRDSRRKRATKAFRDAVDGDNHEWRHRWLDANADANGMFRCPSGRVVHRSDSHSDHVAPRTFAKLLAGFLETRGLDIEKVALKSCPGGRRVEIIADDGLREEWRAWHREQAVLEVVSAAENHRRRLAENNTARAGSPAFAKKELDA